MADRTACIDLFATLPQELLLRILALVPADTRMRCAEVCRAWRAAVAQRALWSALDLAGVAPRDNWGPLLHAAAARARGQLHSLDVRHIRFAEDDSSLLDVTTANASSLRRLCVGELEEHAPEFVRRLTRAAPRLTELRVDSVTCGAAHAGALLRRAVPVEGPAVDAQPGGRVVDEGTFNGNGALAAVRAVLVFTGGDDVAVLRDVAAAARAHASLSALALHEAPLATQKAMDAVVDASLALTELYLLNCRLSTDSAPSLVRLVDARALRTLHISNANETLLDLPSALRFEAALRFHITLSVLVLCDVNLWEWEQAGAAVVGALVGHPSLHTLCLSHNKVSRGSCAVAGAALGALVAANARALQQLYINQCTLGDEGLEPVCSALPRNTHLRKLSLLENQTSRDFGWQVLLPAVHANTSLRELPGHARTAEEDEAQLLMRLRRREDAAAAE